MHDPILALVHEFLTRKLILPFIDGRFQVADGDATHAVIHPSDGFPVAGSTATCCGGANSPAAFNEYFRDQAIARPR